MNFAIHSRVTIQSFPFLLDQFNKITTSLHLPNIILITKQVCFCIYFYQTCFNELTDKKEYICIHGLPFWLKRIFCYRTLLQTRFFREVPIRLAIVTTYTKLSSFWKSITRLLLFYNKSSLLWIVAAGFAAYVCLGLQRTPCIFLHFWMHLVKPIKYWS